MRPVLTSILLIIAALVTACSPRPSAAAVTQPLAAFTSTVPASTPTSTQAPPTAVPTETPTATIPATPVPPPPLPLYTINVDFNYAQSTGRVEERIEYTNTASQSLTDLRLVTPMLQYQGAVQFLGLSWVGGPQDGQTIENAVLQDIQVVIPLVQPLLPGEEVGLKVSYTFTLPTQSAVGGERPLPIGTTNRQANLVDWYPFIPPYQEGTGWLAHPPAYYGENLVYDLADFDVNLRLVDGRSDLVVAASAAVEKDGEWLRYHHKAARTFALSISQEYLVETAVAGNVTVSSYYFSFNEEAGKRVLQTTVEALDLFSELFGPYPHATLAVVEADFYDGMEYDGLYFLSRAFYNVHQGEAGDYLVAIAAHETAHQWWYGSVGNDQAYEPWLDEAMCTYSERIYYEFYYPEALDWWWQYRINYYNPSGWVNTSVYNPQGELQTYQDYRNAVYLNGARFLEDLRVLMGDDAFYNFLNAYAAQFSGKIAFQTDFFQLVSQYTQADLTPLMDQYFYQQP